MAIYNGNKLVKKLHVGDQRVRAIYAGAEKVWPSIVRVEQGEEYGEWTYDDPVRRRTVTPWEQGVYCDDTLGERRTGTPYTQEETAAVENEWDGVTFWNGYCDLNYNYIEYTKIRVRYNYSDGIIRYSDYRNGDWRASRIDGECGWVRSTRVVSDWTNTGVLCNANAQAGYDCDGTYRVQYYQQRRTLEECYPDGSGGINRRDEYRAGSVASREQVDGYCGFTSDPIIIINMSESTWNGSFDEPNGVATIKTTTGKRFQQLDYENTLTLRLGETLESIDIYFCNSGYTYTDFQVQLNGKEVDRVRVEADACGTLQVHPNHAYTSGSATYNIQVTENG